MGILTKGSILCGLLAIVVGVHCIIFSSDQEAMGYLTKGGLLAALLAIALGLYYAVLAPYPKPPAMKDGWYGPGTETKPDDLTIHDFKIHVPEETLSDLQDRLKKTRLTPDLEGGTFDYGMQTQALQEIINYWQTTYDWRKHEAILNSFDQYKTQIEGLMIHYIHVKSKHVTAKPLLLVNGWPSSVWEFYKVLPMLTDPTSHGGTDRDAFHVICPSIPGFGFSDKPRHTGFDVEAAARIFKKLMTRIGYSSFYLQGGDWGSAIGTIMAQAYPKAIKGLHLSMVPPSLNRMVYVKQFLATIWPSLVADPSESWKIVPLKEFFREFLEETGYFHIQATKPDTVGVGLDDSPAALAAYLLEKYATDQHEGIQARSTASGGLLNNFSADQLITGLMVYWITGTGKSAVRFYKEFLYGRALKKDGWDLVPVIVPTGIATAPYDTAPPILRSAAALKYHNIIHSKTLPRGGHFAALEEPTAYVQDIRAFIQKLT